jgi:hypothetical protein
MSRYLFAFLALLAVTVTAVPVQAQQGFENMVARVPSRANVLVLFNVEKILASPVAEREGWREKHIKSYEAGLNVLPPDTLRFVLSSQIDFEFMTPTWQVDVYHIDRHLTLPAIAEKHNGKPDQFGDVKALKLPGDTYLVLFDDRTGSTFRPDNRQMVGRWIDLVKSRTQHALSPYLTKALGYADIVGSPIILAVDLKNVISPVEIRERLGQSEVLKNFRADVDEVTSVLSTIEGVTLGITLGEQPFGAIKVEFGKEVAPLSSFAKPLLLEILRKRGVMIDDFINWQTKLSSTQVSLSGYLTEAGMNRIFSLVDAPNATMHSDSLEQAMPQQQQDPKAQPTLTYFREVTHLIDDLRGKGWQTQGQAAVFFDKYARKIDQLPMLNVDSDMLDYGAYVANQMRQASAALRGAAISSRQRQVKLPNFYKTYVQGEVIGATRWRTHGAYSWVNFEDRARKQQARTQVRAEERLKGNAAMLQIMGELDNVTAEARRAMTQRYQVQF